MKRDEFCFEFLSKTNSRWKSLLDEGKKNIVWNVRFDLIVCVGVTNFASSSSHFHPNGGVDGGLNDFDFNNQQQNYGLGYDTAPAADTSGSETGYQNVWTYPPDSSANAVSASYGSSNNRWVIVPTAGRFLFHLKMNALRTW